MNNIFDGRFFFAKKKDSIYPNSREITLEGETFLNVDVSEDESLIEADFYETN